VLCFPYPGIDGFCRDKIFPPLKGEDGHTTRYLQRKDSGVHLYIPPLARAALTNPDVTLYITEGEKKAAKACQEGFPCIGLGGLWCWIENGKPIAELDCIAWQERHVVLVPDNDPWQDRHDLLVRGGREVVFACEQVSLSSPLFNEARRREECRQERLRTEEAQSDTTSDQHPMPEPWPVLDSAAL